ncbi:MAG: hypothetical protein COA95_11040 [Methylophaga sp.]|nr:MAG: hypothetical protein COA95_11040 [Methylophaga sp.]
MKKVMLFIVALMFSVAANAAPLDLTLINANSGNAQVAPGSGTVVSGAASVTGASATSPDVFELIVADAGTLTFAGSLHPTGPTSFFEVFSGMTSILSLTGTAATGLFSTSLFVDAGTYLISVFSEGGTGGYNFTVATPIPAALFLFAPALLGFLGLRRKATLAA